MKKEIINEGGVLGSENPSISESDYSLIKDEINKFINNKSYEQKIMSKLNVLNYKMEDYLNNDNPDKFYR